MGIIQSSLQVQTVEFDFAKLGTGGGGVGTYNLGAIIPRYATIMYTFINPIQLFNSGGGLATLEFGIQPRGSGAAPTTDALFPVALANSYLPAVGGYGNGAVLGANPLYISSYAAEITVTVGVAAITSGKLLFGAIYIEKML